MQRELLNCDAGEPLEISGGGGEGILRDINFFAYIFIFAPPSI